MKSSKRHIYFITGASGVGKTTLVSQLEKKYGRRPNWLFLHFDSIGVPSEDEMRVKYGSGENWQRKTIKLWIQKMLTEYKDKTVIIMEGQVNLNFIKMSFEEHDFFDYTIVLVDCNKIVMRERLVNERKQSELATDEMNNWRDLLLEQAQSQGADIIDTNELNKDDSVTAFKKILIREGFL